MQCEFSFQSESEGESEKTSHGLLRQCCFQTMPPLVLATRLGNTLFVSFTKLDPRTSNKWMMTLLRGLQLHKGTLPYHMESASGHVRPDRHVAIDRSLPLLPAQERERERGTGRERKRRKKKDALIIRNQDGFARSITETVFLIVWVSALCILVQIRSAWDLKP